MREKLQAPAIVTRSAHAPSSPPFQGTAVVARSDDEPAGMVCCPASTEPSDQALVALYRASDQQAAERLYRRYRKRLTNLIELRRSLDLVRCEGVDDIVQFVFGSFFRRVADGSCIIKDGDTAWKPMRIIAQDRLRAQENYFRAAKRDVQRTFDGAKAWQLLESTAAGNANAVDPLELGVRNTLDRLPPGHRLAVRLRMDGFTLEEVARRTRGTKFIVRRVIREARIKLGELDQNVD